MSYTKTFYWRADSFATTDYSSGYKYPITLPADGVWEITEFGVNAQTTYAAADTNYQTFTLYNNAGSSIASVANGSSTTGLAIGPTVVTGVDTSMTASTKNIDCSSANKTIYVMTSSTGDGKAMLGISGWVKAKLKRA